MDYRAVWEQHSGVIYDVVETARVREQAGRSRTETAVGIGLVGISLLDGPAPLMDIIAIVGWSLLAD